MQPATYFTERQFVHNGANITVYLHERTPYAIASNTAFMSFYGYSVAQALRIFYTTFKI